MLKLLAGLLFCAIAILNGGVNSLIFASAIHETIIFQGNPTKEQIAEWSNLPGARNFLFQMDGVTNEELRELAALKGADKIQIERNSYPEQSELSGWKSLARKGVEFVGLGIQLPPVAEIQRLNEIGFQKLIFILDYIPDLEEAKLISRLKGDVSITFAMSSYPKYENKEVLLGIPASVAFTFATSYWPWYSHMDLFNMLPNRQAVRVTGMFPTDKHFKYLLNIKSLDRVIVETEFDPSEKVWGKFGKLPVTWINKDRIPSSEALAAFEASSKDGAVRKLTIDTDVPLTEEELRVLSSVAIPVELVHKHFLANCPVSWEYSHFEGIDSCQNSNQNSNKMQLPLTRPRRKFLSWPAGAIPAKQLL